MGSSLGGLRRGSIAEMNVVPLIDILLVLLIIFMVISPRMPVGLPAVLPERAMGPEPQRAPDAVVVQLFADGSLRINRDAVAWQDLQGRLEEVFEGRANRVAFVRGDGALEFGAVARAIDIMRGSAITSVGLMTPELENAR
jgi:biopolymer transport protein ExbD